MMLYVLSLGHLYAQTPHLTLVHLLPLVPDLYLKLLHGYRNLSLMPLL